MPTLRITTNITNITNNAWMDANDLEPVEMSYRTNKNEHECQNWPVRTAFALHIRDNVNKA